MLLRSPSSQTKMILQSPAPAGLARVWTTYLPAAHLKIQVLTSAMQQRVPFAPWGSLGAPLPIEQPPLPANRCQRGAGGEGRRQERHVQAPRPLTRFLQHQSGTQQSRVAAAAQQQQPISYLEDQAPCQRQLTNHRPPKQGRPRDELRALLLMAALLCPPCPTPCSHPQRDREGSAGDR